MWHLVLWIFSIHRKACPAKLVLLWVPRCPEPSLVTTTIRSTILQGCGSHVYSLLLVPLSIQSETKCEFQFSFTRV